MQYKMVFGGELQVIQAWQVQLSDVNNLPEFLCNGALLVNKDGGVFFYQQNGPCFVVVNGDDVNPTAVEEGLWIVKTQGGFIDVVGNGEFEELYSPQ